MEKNTTMHITDRSVETTSDEVPFMGAVFLQSLVSLAVAVLAVIGVLAGVFTITANTSLEMP